MLPTQSIPSSASMSYPDQCYPYPGETQQPLPSQTSAFPTSGASRRAVAAARTTALFDTLTRSVEDLLSVASPTGSGVTSPAATASRRPRSRSRSKSRSRSRSHSPSRSSARSRSPTSGPSIRASMTQGPGRPLHLHVPTPATPPRSTSTSSSPHSAAFAMSHHPLHAHPSPSNNKSLPESPARQRHRRSSHGNGISPTQSSSATSPAAGGSKSMESLSAANDMLLRTALSLTSSNHDAASAELDPTLAHLLSQLASTTVELNRALASRDSRTDPLELSANQVVLTTASLALLSRLRCLDGKWRAPLAEHRMDMMQKEHEESIKVMRADSTFNNTTSTAVHHPGGYHHDQELVDPRVAGMHTPPPPPSSSSSTMAHHQQRTQPQVSSHRHNSLVSEPAYSHSNQRSSSSHPQQHYPQQYSLHPDTVGIVGSRPSPSRSRDPSVRASWHAGAQPHQGAFNFDDFAQHLSNAAAATGHHSPTPARPSHYPPPSMGPPQTSSQSLRYPTTPSRGTSGISHQGSRPSSPMTQIYQPSLYAAAPAAIPTPSPQSYRQPPPPSPSAARCSSGTPRASLASIADVSPSLDPAWPESMLPPSATPASPDRGLRTPRNRPTSALSDAATPRQRHASSPAISTNGGHPGPGTGRDDVTNYFSNARPPSPPSFASTVATAGGPAALGGSGSPRGGGGGGGVDLHTMATAAGANMGSGTLRGIRSVEQRGMEGFSPFRSVTPQVQGLSPSRQGHHRSSGAMGTGGRR